jgi:Leucine-rich repeat (LRR) protein
MCVFNGGVPVVEECMEDYDESKAEQCDDECLCRVVNNLTVADCIIEDDFKIPKLSKHVDVLCVVFADETPLNCTELFEAASTVSALYLVSNIEECRPSDILILKNLQRVTFKYIDVSPQQFAKLVANIPLLTRLQCIDCELQQAHLHALERRLPSLKHLDTISLKTNEITVLDLSALTHKNRIRLLDFSSNHLNGVFANTVVADLEELYLRDNGLRAIFQTCSEDGTSLFPKLRVLVLAQNKLATIQDTVCLDKLQYLNLDGNHFSKEYFPESNFVWQQCPDMVRIDLSHTTYRGNIEGRDIPINIGTFANMAALRYVFMQGCIAHHIAVLIAHFINCSQLRVLDLSDNVIMDQLGNYTYNVPLKPEQSVQYIESLDMSTCQLGVSTDKTALRTMISLLPNLLELDISQNSLRFIPPDFFDLLPKLQALDLSNNLLTAVSPYIFGAPSWIEAVSIWTWVTILSAVIVKSCGSSLR